MPSKNIDDSTASSTTNVDFVEELVAAIDHNLRLKSRQHSSFCKQKRITPYYLPTHRKDNSDSNDDCSEHCKYCCKQYNPLFRHQKTNCQDDKKSLEDPYEMLQDLLKEGGLIKEAVKRLQIGLDQPKSPKTNHYDKDPDLEHFNNPKVLAI